MEYRALPHGAPTERFSTLGLGLGGIQQAPAAEIRQVIETAIAHGINFFDLCAGAAKTYAPSARPSAAAGSRSSSSCIWALSTTKAANTAGPGI